MKTFLFLLVLILLARTEAFPEEKKYRSPYNRSWEYLLYKGGEYSRGGDIEGSIEHFREATALYPWNASLHYCLGYSYYKGRDYDKAEKSFLRTVELDPLFAEAYFYLAVIEKKQGNDARVIEYLDKVTDLNRPFKSAYFNKGVTYLDMDMPVEAI